MAVSRRLRFEVLRRDNHTCRYCGGSAPDVKLTVDHVIPVTLGGGDEPNNLVTACADCNAGKSSVSPDSPIVEDVDAAALLFGKAIEVAAERARSDRDDLAQLLDVFDDHWYSWGWSPDGDMPSRPRDWVDSIERFLTLGLDIDDLERFVQKTMRHQTGAAGKWKYFCGCCWKEISNRQEAARRLIEDGEV